MSQHFVWCPWSPFEQQLRDWLWPQVDFVGGYDSAAKKLKVAVIELQAARNDHVWSREILVAACNDGLSDVVVQFCMDALLPAPRVEPVGRNGAPAKHTKGTSDVPIKYSHRPEIDAIIKRQEKAEKKP